MLSHGHNLGNNGVLGPFHTKHLCELPKVLGGRFSNRENSITKPTHTEVAKLFIEELNSELTGKKRNIFNYGKTNSPLLVLSQLDNGRQQRLREKLNSDNYNS